MKQLDVGHEADSMTRTKRQDVWIKEVFVNGAKDVRKRGPGAVENDVRSNLLFRHARKRRRVVIYSKSHMEVISGAKRDRDYGLPLSRPLVDGRALQVLLSAAPASQLPIP